MGPIAAPVADEQRRPIDVYSHSAEWWREHDLAELRFHLAESELDYNTACSILGGADPAATKEQRKEAEAVEQSAFVEMCKLEEEIERLERAPRRSTGRTPAPTLVPRLLRIRTRPRERRPGRRRRQVARAGPNDDSDSDGEGDDVGRRRWRERRPA